MKRFLILLIIVTTALSACTSNEPITQNSPPENTNEAKPIELRIDTTPLWELSEETQRLIIDSELLINGVKTKEGYFLANNIPCPIATIEKYDNYGKKLWTKEYEYDYESVNIKHIIATKDGGFCFSIYPVPNLSSVTPAFIKCNKEGKIIWRFDFEHSSVIDDIHEGKNDDILVFSSFRSNSGLDSIYSFRINSSGVLIKEKSYGGSDCDSIYETYDLGDIGTLALISTQSSDGTFAASDDGYPVEVLALFDDELNIKWHQPIDFFYPKACIVSEDFIYVGADGDCSIKKLDQKGELLWEQPHSKDGFEFVGEYEGMIVTYEPNKLTFFDETGNVAENIPFTFGTRIKGFLPYEEGFLVISERKTGKLETPFYVNCQWFKTEHVYTGYDQQGNVVWQEAHDNTPEYLLNWSDNEIVEFNP